MSERKKTEEAEPLSAEDDLTLTRIHTIFGGKPSEEELQKLERRQNRADAQDKSTS